MARKAQERRSPKRIASGFAKADADAQQWRQLWRLAYRYTIPNRDIVDRRSGGQYTGHYIFDSVGVESTHNGVGRLKEALFPSNGEWVRLKPGPSVNKEVRDQASKTLDAACDMWHALMRRSNFETEVGEAFLDLYVGTMTLVFNEGVDTDPFSFTSIPTPMVCIVMGANGDWREIYRKTRMHPANIRGTWPEAILPKKIEEMLEDEKAEVEIIDCCYREGDVTYYEAVLAGEDHHLLPKPRLYKGAPPWGVVHWSRMPEEQFGRGPIVYALADILTANKVVELHLKQASISLSGFWTATDDGVLNPNNIRLTPGAIIPVARNAGHPMGPSLASLVPPTNFDLSMLVLNELHERIRRALYDRRLPPDTGPVRSATEIAERVAETAMDVGTPFTRIFKQLVMWLVHRGLQIMARKKLIDFPFEIDGSSVEVEIVAPIAHAAGLGKAKTVLSWLEMIGQLGPEVVAGTAAIEDLPRWFAEQLGVPASLVRTRENQQQLMQAVAQMVAARQQSGAPGQPPGAPQGPPQQVTASGGPGMPAGSDSEMGGMVQ